MNGIKTLQENNKRKKFFKVITIPCQMPSDILRKKKLLIGFDPNLFTKKSLSIFFGKSECKFKPLLKNLIDAIWKRKVKKNKNKFFVLPAGSVGEKYQSKINKITNYLKRKKSDFLFITASENNAWLFNIRGRDTKYTPIPYSYVLIDKNKNIKFFCDLKKISSTFKSYFNVEFLDIKICSKILSKIKSGKFIIDKNSCSYFFENIISKNNRIFSLQDPIYFFKSIKCMQEIENKKKNTV